MASNYVQQGKHLVVTKAAISSGDPFMAGQIPCVALTDTNAAGTVVAATEGVFDLAVVGETTVNAAVAIGDILYYDTDKINKDSANGIRYGYALEAVTSGATTTIMVKVGY